MKLWHGDKVSLPCSSAAQDPEERKDYPQDKTPRRDPQEEQPKPPLPRAPPLHHVGIPPVGVLLWLGGQDPCACGRGTVAVGLSGGRVCSGMGTTNRHV